GFIMDYETFEGFFNRMKDVKIATIGGYTLEYWTIESILPLLPDSEYITYSKGDLEIGVDHIGHYFEVGSLSSIYNSSFDEGINNFDNLIDYLDYLYDNSKEEERQQEQRRIEHLKEEERKQKKVDDFINPN